MCTVTARKRFDSSSGPPEKVVTNFSRLSNLISDVLFGLVFFFLLPVDVAAGDRAEVFVCNVKSPNLRLIAAN